LIKIQAPSRKVLAGGLFFILLGLACYVPVRLDCRDKEDGKWTLWILESNCMDLSNANTNTRNDALAAMAGVSFGWGICLMIASCALYFHLLVPDDDDTTVASNEPEMLECGNTTTQPALEMERSTEDNDDVDEERGRRREEEDDEEQQQQQPLPQQSTSLSSHG
jgi:hypothetical protein